MNSWMLPRGGSKYQRAECQVVGRDAVDHEADGLFTIAGRVESQRSDSSNGPRGESRLRRRYRSRHEQTQIREVASVQRDLLNGIGGDDVADGGGCPIDERRFGANDNRLGAFADGQKEITYEASADIDIERLDAFGTKSGRLSRDRVRATGNGADVVASFGVGLDGHVETDRLVLHADDRARKGRPGRIEHAAVKPRQGLRIHHRVCAPHHCDGERGAADDAPLHEHIAGPISSLVYRASATSPTPATSASLGEARYSSRTRGYPRGADAIVCLSSPF